MSGRKRVRGKDLHVADEGAVEYDDPLDVIPMAHEGPRAPDRAGSDKSTTAKQSVSAVVEHGVGQSSKRARHHGGHGYIESELHDLLDSTNGVDMRHTSDQPIDEWDGAGDGHVAEGEDTVNFRKLPRRVYTEAEVNHVLRLFDEHGTFTAAAKAANAIPGLEKVSSCHAGVLQHMLSKMRRQSAFFSCRLPIVWLADGTV